MDNPHNDWKAIKFEQGLKPELQNFVGILEIRDYPTLVNKCRVAEQKLQVLKLEKPKDMVAQDVKRFNSEGKFQKTLRPLPTINKGKQVQGTSIGTCSGCQKCGRYNAKRACPTYQRECYRCGKMGHYARMCKSGAPPQPKSQNQGRVITLQWELVKCRSYL